VKDRIKNASWMIAIVLVAFGLLHKFAGIGTEFAQSSSVTFFHIANTVLLLGIFFSLQKGE